MAFFHGFEVDFDIAGRLATRPSGHPREIVSLDQRQGSVIHYAGGNQNRSLSPVARYQIYADWHIRPNGFGNGFTGNGLMYHLGVGEEGESYGTFGDGTTDPRRSRRGLAVRWHAGSSVHNRTWLSMNVPIGGNQKPTYAQKVTLEELIHQAIRLGVGQDVRQVIGHLEAAPGTTECCGEELMREFVRRIRAGTRIGPEAPVIPEADHLVITVPGLGIFWVVQNIYRRYAMLEEAPYVFGYPISGMTGNTSDGYVQSFERARLEWRPGSWPARHDVHLARVGYERAKEGGLLDNSAFDPIPDPQDPLRLWFPQTGHQLYGRWKAFWETFGGLEYLGYPISEVYHSEEQGCPIQYTERARLEYHQDSGWDELYQDIALGRVEAEIRDMAA